MIYFIQMRLMIFDYFKQTFPCCIFFTSEHVHAVLELHNLRHSNLHQSELIIQIWKNFFFNLFHLNPRPSDQRDGSQMEPSDVDLPSHVDFPFKGPTLNVSGDAFPGPFRFLFHSPSSLKSLDVTMEALGPALTKWELDIMPTINGLEDLSLQVCYPEHELQMSQVLSGASSLKKLSVCIAQSRGLLHATAEEYWEDNLARGVAEGPKTFETVVEFVATSRTIERVDLGIGSPLGYQVVIGQWARKLSRQVG